MTKQHIERKTDRDRATFGRLRRINPRIHAINTSTENRVSMNTSQIRTFTTTFQCYNIVLNRNAPIDCHKVITTTTTNKWHSSNTYKIYRNRLRLFCQQLSGRSRLSAEFRRDIKLSRLLNACQWIRNMGKIQSISNNVKRINTQSAFQEITGSIKLSI